MIKSSIVEKKVQMSQLEVKQYFEMLNKYISGNGIDAGLTYAAIKTISTNIFVKHFKILLNL